MLPVVFVSINKKMEEMARHVSRELDIDVCFENIERTSIDEIIRKYPQTEVFISRGGNARDLKEKTNKTVLSLEITIHEILQDIFGLVAQGSKNIAVLSTPDLIGDNEETYELFGAKIRFIPANAAKVKSIFPELIKKGMDGVIGGRAASKLSNDHNINTRPLQNGRPSIKSCLEQALRIVEINEQNRERLKLRSDSISKHSESLYCAIESALESVEELMGSSEELAAIGRNNSDAAERAFQGVDRTADVIQIVKNISGKTNLLGLNAEIEAARSGEYGRGFAVVASEIRKLSVQSSDQAKKVDEIITTLSKEIKEVLENTVATSKISREQAESNELLVNMLEELRQTGQVLIELVGKQPLS